MKSSNTANEISNRELNYIKFYVVQHYFFQHIQIVSRDLVEVMGCRTVFNCMIILCIGDITVQSESTFDSSLLLF